MKLLARNGKLVVGKQLTMVRSSWLVETMVRLWAETTEKYSVRKCAEHVGVTCGDTISILRRHSLSYYRGILINCYFQ